MSSDFDLFFLLPNETIIDIAIYLPINQIVNLSLCNLRFNTLICDNDYFWRQRFYLDYDEINHVGSWKELYKNFGNVWTFGVNQYGQLGIGNTDDQNKPTQIANTKAK
jgi:hypothetical protein